MSDLAARLRREWWRRTPDLCYTAANEIERLQAIALRRGAALQSLLDHYAGLVNSGDAGTWDPENETVVKLARAALTESHY